MASDTTWSMAERTLAGQDFGNGIIKAEFDMLAGNDQIQHNRRSGRALGTIGQPGKVPGLVQEIPVTELEFWLLPAD